MGTRTPLKGCPLSVRQFGPDTILTVRDMYGLSGIMDFKGVNIILDLKRAILTELCDHMNDNTEMCYPSRKRLAKLTGYNVSSVTRHLKNLRNRGLI